MTEINSTDDMLYFSPGSIRAAVKGSKSADLWKVKREQIFIHPDFNIREKNDEYREHVRHLADLMKANGYDFAKPIKAFAAKENGNDLLYVIDGHQRLEAFDLAVEEGADLQYISVVTAPVGTSMQDVIADLCNTNAGRPLSTYEMSKLCKRLLAYGSDQADIARRLGFTQRHIANLLALQAAPAEVRQMVESGEVSTSMAIAAVQKNDPNTAIKNLRTAVETAKAQGKTKATPKHLPKQDAIDKPKKAKAVHKSNQAAQSAELAERGMAWLKENELVNQDTLRLLAFLAGVDPNELPQ